MYKKSVRVVRSNPEVYYYNNPEEHWTEHEYYNKERLETYMWSEEWSRKKGLKFREVGYLCEKCGETRNLEVHHITYDRLGHENLKDLQVLCRICHEFMHDIRNRPNINYKWKTSKDMSKKKRLSQKNKVELFFGERKKTIWTKTKSGIGYEKSN